MAVKTRRTARTQPASDPARFVLAQRAPERIVAPNDVAQLAQTLRECDEAGEAAVLFGGGTLQHAGAAPARYDVAVDLTGLHGVVAYEPNDLTISVRVGTTLAELAKTLALHRQFLPIDAPRPRVGTVGGAVAAGWAGPRRMAYGRARDLIIGSSVVLADGTVAKAGGMVVKNVSGYDMSRLYAGSFGTLAALTSINFKTLPAPQARRAALAPLPENSRERAVEHVRGLRIEPTMALAAAGFPELDGPDGVDGRLVLLYEGSADAVERATRDLRSALGAAGVPATTIVDDGADGVVQRAVDAYVKPLGTRSITYRLAGLPSDAHARARIIVEAARRHGLHCETIVDLWTGDVIARVSAATDGAFEVTAIPFDEEVHVALERATVLSAPERLWTRIDAWGTPPAAVEGMRRLKLRFDPKGTLAPGRFVGGI